MYINIQLYLSSLGLQEFKKRVLDGILL